MEFSERVLVLQVGRFREADLWVRFLSPTRGLLSAFAFGGSRSRRRFVGCLDSFNEISVRVSSSRRGAYLALEEGVLIKGLTRLRSDWSRFGLAVNCMRFLQSFGVAPDGAAQAHALMSGMLRLLEEEECLPQFLPLYFRARLAFDHGYSLSGALCGKCRDALVPSCSGDYDAPEPWRGNADGDCSPAASSGRGAFFLPGEGLVLCPDCAGAVTGQRFFLGPEALRCLESIRTLPVEQWGRLCPPAASSRQLARMVDGFIQYHIGIAWENGRFVKV
jgi:DNA repair protein RecO (recombination protein O)